MFVHRDYLMPKPEDIRPYSTSKRALIFLSIKIIIININHHCHRLSNASTSIHPPSEASPRTVHHMLLILPTNRNSIEEAHRCNLQASSSPVTATSNGAKSSSSRLIDDLSPSNDTQLPSPTSVPK